MMFVLKLNAAGVRPAIMTLLAIAGTAGATDVQASDTPGWKSVDGTVPVKVTLTGVQDVAAPIYVSIQTRGDYMSMKGSGGILQNAPGGTVQGTFYAPAAGEYSVSIWHDLDDDGRFSMSETGQVMDSFGASGNAPKDRSPTFDDVKINVPADGTSVTIAMINPS